MEEQIKKIILKHYKDAWTKVWFEDLVKELAEILSAEKTKKD